MHAIVGWELELIAPKLCKLIGVEFGERTDEDGYTSEWLLELDAWLANSDLIALGIWSDGDLMFGGDASYFIGYYVSEDHIDEWVSDISIQMNKFKDICSKSKIELQEAKMHHRDDAGFAYACDHEFKKRLTPKELEEQVERNRTFKELKLKKEIEILQDKTNEERYMVACFQLDNPRIYSLCKELLREPDENFWLQLALVTDFMDMGFVGQLMPEMIHGLKSELEIVRQCSKLYLSNYLEEYNNEDDLIYVNLELKSFENNTLEEILKLNSPTQLSMFSHLDGGMMNKIISEISDSTSNPSRRA